MHFTPSDALTVDAAGPAAPFYALIDTGEVVPLGLHPSWESAADCADKKYHAVWIMGANELRGMLGSALRALEAA